MSICESNHNFYAVYKNGQSITFSNAEKHDAKIVSDIYKKIQITSFNYKQKFDPENDLNFGKTGGMFLINNEESFLRLLDDKDSTIIIARDDNRKPCGLLWASASDPSFADFDFSAYNIFDSHKTIFPIREILVAPDNGFNYIPALLLYIFFKNVFPKKHTYAICEVYRLLKYEIENKIIEINILNHSARVIENCFAKHFSTLPQGERTIVNIPSSKVYIEPQAYFWDINKAISDFNIFFERQGIVVNEKVDENET